MHHRIVRGVRPRSVQTRISLAAACTSFAGVYLIITALEFHLLKDSDMFMHITVGQFILQNWSFPDADTFSYTKFGETWRATDWISELILAISYEVGQWRGVTEVLAITCGLISGTLTFYLAKILRLSIAIGLSLLIIVLISPHFLGRPVIFSYLLLTFWIVIILELEDNGWTNPFGFTLIPLMLLWANVHGSFTFGLVIIYFFLCFAIYEAYTQKDAGNRRRLTILLVGVTAAALITPYGALSALKTIKLMSVPALAQIDEWGAPDFQHDPIHLASIVVVFALLAYSGIRLRGPRLLTLLLVTVFALQHKRGLGLFGLVAPLLLARPLSTWAPFLGVQPVLDPVARFANRRSAAIATACIIMVTIAAVMRWTMASPIEPPTRTAPQKALAAAKLAGVSGHVLNSYGFGGYLIFNGIPTFVDGR